MRFCIPKRLFISLMNIEQPSGYNHSTVHSATTIPSRSPCKVQVSETAFVSIKTEFLEHYANAYQKPELNKFALLLFEK